MLGHVLAGGGKRIRPAIALLAGKFGRVQSRAACAARASIELLHTATSSSDRRDRCLAVASRPPTANELSTTQRRSCWATTCSRHSAELISRTENTKVVRLFAYTIMAIAAASCTRT